MVAFACMVKATATMDVMRIFMVLFFVDLRLFVGLHPFTGEAREILIAKKIDFGVKADERNGGRTRGGGKGVVA